MNWFPLAILFMFFSALHTICIKYAGSGITPLYAMLVSNIVVFTGSVILYLSFKYSGMEMVATKPSLLWMVGAGICVIIFEIAFLYIFYANAPIATATTIMRVGTLGLVFIAGYYLFNEKLDLTKIVGLLFGITSIYLLSKK